MAQKEPQKYKGQVMVTSHNGLVQPARADAKGRLYTNQQDTTGRNGLNTIFGDRVTASRFLNFSSIFAYGIDTRKFIDDSASTGSYSFEGNLLKLSTGTATDGIGALESKAGVRYRTGRDAEILFTARYSTGQPNSHQLVGLFDNITGLAIGYVNENFGVVLKRDGVIDFIPQSDFNTDKVNGNSVSEFDINPNNINIFRISFGYLGSASIVFEVYGGMHIGWIPMHVIDVTNSRLETHINSPYLPVRYEVVNSGNSTDLAVYCGSVMVGVIHDSERAISDSSSREFTVSKRNIPTSADVEEILGVFHNKATFNEIKNRIISKLILMTTTTDGTKAVEFSVKKLKVDVTDGTPEDISQNSILEEIVGGTVTQTNLDNAEVLLTFETGSVDSFYKELGNINIQLYPDEYVVITAFSTNASEISFSIRESERF